MDMHQHRKRLMRLHLLAVNQAGEEMFEREWKSYNEFLPVRIITLNIFKESRVDYAFVLKLRDLLALTLVTCRNRNHDSDQYMVAGGGFKSLDRRGGDGNRSSRITVGSRVGLSPVHACADGVMRDEV
ncbi:hypothetical protein OIU84_003698 [Salix udensis]|uniref:Uncharacterized protein n=1 Tax=Salix udensis TaxID=889485 RepID=A0AAD6K0G2_9ROSI|nr:hypothetical protein OIU84_003698 [Salix udensis]